MRRFLPYIFAHLSPFVKRFIGATVFRGQERRKCFLHSMKTGAGIMSIPATRSEEKLYLFG